jgi:hypothetical protein
MKYIITTCPIFNYTFDNTKYKLIFMHPSLRNEINVIKKYGLTDYITSLYLHRKIGRTNSLFDIFIQSQNDLCNITDATHFILVNCSVIINHHVISYCKKNNISMFNIHPGNIDCLGRHPLVKSIKTNTYGIFCHEVTNKIDDTKNVLYKYCLYSQDQQSGLNFIKIKTEFILKEI